MTLLSKLRRNRNESSSASDTIKSIRQVRGGYLFVIKGNEDVIWYLREIQMLFALEKLRVPFVNMRFGPVSKSVFVEVA